MIVDTSALLAYLNRGETRHADVRAAIDADPGPFVVSPFVLAELDYLVLTRHGVAAELAALDELASGRWQLVGLEQTEIRRARELVARFADERIGLTDASLIVLAARHHTRVIATLDRRHFSVLRLLDGHPVMIVP